MDFLSYLRTQNHSFIHKIMKRLHLLLLPLLCLTACTVAHKGQYVEKKPDLNALQKADRIEGYKGNVFYIVRPDEGKLKTVSSADFGFSTSATDNSEALRKALHYCQENPGTRLFVEKGEYHFSPTSPLVLQGLRDVLIDGPEAKFLTRTRGTFLHLTDCRSTEIRGLSFDWERDSDPLDDIVNICHVDKENKCFDLVFPLREEIDEGMPIKSITQCDPETFTFGAKGASQEVYFQQNPVIESVQKTDRNVLHMRLTVNPMFSEGITAILRHYVYDGTVFALEEGNSHLTFQNLRIYGSPGMAVVASGRSSHFQVLDTYVGVDPALQDKHHVSLGADAFHFVNTNGCIRLEGCDVSKQGDDALNIHDGLGYLYEVDGCTAKMHASALLVEKGDTMSFRNPGYGKTGFFAVVEEVSTHGTKKEIRFDRDISTHVEAGYTAWNMGYDSKNYVVRNNYFHENRARGLLMQSSEGVCENNRFYKIQGPAIRIVMDIIPHLWQEGTGVDGIIIQRNTFERCDYSQWGRLIEISTNIDGHKADTVVFRNIDIQDNQFSGSESSVLDADNVEGLSFCGNKIDASAPSCAFRFGEHCSQMLFKENILSGKYAKEVEESFADRNQ